MLRVISGKYRSLKLDQPPLEITRPTTDRIRESIFNIIQNEIPNSIVLDAFSGSGAMAIESVSRAAMKAVCVEKNKLAYEVLTSNINRLKITNIDTYNQDILNFLEQKNNISFDLIFLDPPYDINTEQLLNILTIIVDKGFLKKYGMIVYETSIEKEVITLPKKLLISDERVYGKTKIFFLKMII